MKRKRIFGVGYVVFLLLIWLFVPKVLAADSISTNSAEEYYWEDFMETAVIQYDQSESELEFFTKVMERNAGVAVDEGLNTELDFYFGIMKNTQIHTYLNNQGDFTNLVTEVKRYFTDFKGWTISGLGRLFYLKDQFTTPSVKVLASKAFNDKLAMHNSFQLYFWESGLIGKRLDNGLTYNINDRNFIKMRLKTSFDDAISEATFDFRVAFKTIVNHQTNLIMYGYFEKDNFHLENIVEFKPVLPLKLSINTIINTGGNEINWVVVKGKYTLSDQWTLESEYQKELLEDGYRCLKTGFIFRI